MTRLVFFALVKGETFDSFIHQELDRKEDMFFSAKKIGFFTFRNNKKYQNRINEKKRKQIKKRNCVKNLTKNELTFGLRWNDQKGKNRLKEKKGWKLRRAREK